jgi:glycosyltransferase involved in cell wall biosynthesis
VNAPRETEPALGVNVIGYLRSVLGVGQIARGAIAAIDAAEIPVLPVRLSPPATLDDLPFADVPWSRASFPINLVCANAEFMPALAADPAGIMRDRYSIGWWWWELASFPEPLLDSFEHVDEVWAGSAFVADALGPISPVPVVTMPVPVQLPSDVAVDRSGFGFADDEFAFLFMFDYNSVLERKNPLGLIEAFVAAFAPSAGATLTLKCINERYRPLAHERVCAAAARHPHVRVVTGYLPPARKNSLLASCDCYVSLHRSEGFGLVLAEAMWLAKPVIATGYSGNLDYMSSENSYLVRHSMVEIGDGADPYPPDGQWAEPDLTDAVSQMRNVFEGSDEAATRGLRAARDVRDRHGLAAVAPMFRHRLVEIHERLADGSRSASRTAAPGEPTTPTPGGTAAVHQLLETGPRPPDRSAVGPLGPLARRVALRLMKPFTAHEHQVDELMLRQVDVLSDEIADRFAHVEADLLRHLREARDGDGADPPMFGFPTRIAAIESELTTLRQLVHRLPDWIENWPRQLAELRRSDLYTQAFVGTPLITVRIATYDNIDELTTRALPSVLRQTYPHWELLIVGDGCSDEVARRIDDFRDPRISFWNRSVRGPYPEDRYARWLVTGTHPYNDALAAANGAWIASLDDDDEWADKHLELLLREAQRSHSEVVYGKMHVLIEGSEIETSLGTWPPQRGDFIFQSALCHAALRHFRYDPHAYLLQEPADWNLARRMLDAGVRFRFLDREVGTYHVGRDDLHASWWLDRARRDQAEAARLPSA